MDTENARSETSGSLMTSGQVQNLSEDVNSNEVRRKRPTSLVVACLQCRSRKVRCDAGQPKCGHCTKRFETCEYLERKIRGPDRQPGNRIRKFWKKPETYLETHDSPVQKQTKGIKHSEEIGAGIPECFSPPVDSQNNPSPSDLAYKYHVASTSMKPLCLQAQNSESWIDSTNSYPCIHPQGHFTIPTTLFQSAHIDISRNATLLPAYDLDYIPRGPSIAFSKDTWWDSLLQLYGQDRLQSSRKIRQDINFLFHRTIFWNSFIHLPLFFERLYDPFQRPSLQPSLVLSALAFSTLLQSSETNLGEIGRQRAFLLKDAAQSSLEASINAGWIDHSLVQAALLLTIFEGSAHPYNSPERAASALSLLDSLILSLGLLLIDVHEHTVSIFPADGEPIGSSATPSDSGTGTYLFPQQLPHGATPNFSCVPSSPHETYAQEENADLDSALGRSFQLMFKSTSWPDIQVEGKAEIEKEEARRLCWNALSIATIFRENMAYFQRFPWNLHILKRENFAIFFPEESKRRGEHISNDIYSFNLKDTMWALHCRIMLLWNIYLKFRGYADCDPRKAELSSQILREAAVIESAIARYTRSIGKKIIYLGGDFLFRIKMSVSNDPSCCVPHFRRENISLTDTLHIPGSTSMTSDLNVGGECSCVETWRTQRNQVATGVRRLVDTIFRFGTSASVEIALSKTPLSIWWTMSRIRGGVECWRTNPGFIFALEQSWEFVALADFMLAVWPSPAQKRYLLKLKGELTEACLIAGVAIPPSVPIPGLKSQYDTDMIVTLPLWQSQSSHLHFPTSSPSTAVIPILPVD